MTTKLITETLVRAH